MKSLFSPLEFENEELNIKGRLIHMVLVSVVILILIFVLVIPFVSSESARRSLLLAIPISIAIIAPCATQN